MEPLTLEELSKALELIAESDACGNNTMLASILLIASSNIKDLANAEREAECLALSLWRRHYTKDSPNFELCDSVGGIITQINNMTCELGIVTDLEAEIMRLRCCLNDYIEPSKPLKG